MKKKDEIEELDDVIIDDEVLDDETDNLEEEVIEEPIAKGKPAKKVKSRLSKGAKTGIICAGAAVGVIAVVLVVLLAILPAMGIQVFKKSFVYSYDGPTEVTADLYYDPTASYGLYFYGPNHNSDYDHMTASDVDMIRATTSLSTDYFDPSKPTIIWFHGWESTGSVGDRYLMVGDATHSKFPSNTTNYAHELRAKGYNVATFQFQGVAPSDQNYAKNLPKIFQYTVESFDKGEYSLSFMFASEVAAVFGEDYEQDITFVGHSCGSFVATATDYMLQTFYYTKKITNEHLIANRLILEDPYVSTLGDKAPERLMGTNESLKDRKKCDIVQDMIFTLHNQCKVAVDVYLGMTGASDAFIEPSSHYNKVKSCVAIVDMTGMKTWLGSALGDIHVLTRDWVWSSMISETLKDQDGNLAPSAACTYEEMLGFAGRLYQQNYEGLDLSQDSLKRVPNTKGFIN